MPALALALIRRPQLPSMPGSKKAARIFTCLDGLVELLLHNHGHGLQGRIGEDTN